MRTVAFLITDLDRGGAEGALVRLVGGLDRSRFRPVVYSLTEQGPRGRELAARGIPVRALEAHRHPLVSFVRFTRELRRSPPDILQTLLYHANIFGRVAGRLAGVRRIVSSARVCEVDRPFRAALERLTGAWVDRVTCVAGAVRDYVRRTSGIPGRKLVVIFNGVETQAAPPARGAPPGHRVETVAHLRTQKGIEDLIRAVPVVRRSVPDATVTVVGRGDPEPFRRLSGALGVADAVRFLGEVEDVRPCLDAADLFVLPSRWEGCPNAVLEAMAAGLPVVGTAVGGTPELVREGETGFLVPPGSPGLLGRRMADLLLDPERSRAMGLAGWQRAASEFGMARMIGAYEALYERLLGPFQTG
jgi:glycosyltransferase involved in cell wall biosynthesis